MEVFFGPSGELWRGDCLSILDELKAFGYLANCCVTSPPYFGLRDYGVDGQIGLEETPDQYVAKLVQVFRAVREVLADNGTLWLNLGDSYARAGGWADNAGLSGTKRGESGRAKTNMTGAGGCSQRLAAGFKEKDLIGIPWRVAFALQADGWYLRQDIIWAKPNPMPESVKDRCTKAHEYIFLLSKSPKYYFDAKQIMEPAVYGEAHAKKATSWGMNRKHPNKPNVEKYAFVGDNHTCHKDDDGRYMKNRRSVWNVSTKPFKEAHFATFPPDLIEPCILAGCPLGGTVLDPFMGAGTTAVVAERLGRKWVGSELNPDYCNIAMNRINSGVKA